MNQINLTITGDRGFTVRCTATSDRPPEMGRVIELPTRGLNLVATIKSISPIDSNSFHVNARLLRMKRI